MSITLHNFFSALSFFKTINHWHSLIWNPFWISLGSRVDLPFLNLFWPMKRRFVWNEHIDQKKHLLIRFEHFVWPACKTRFRNVTTYTSLLLVNVVRVDITWQAKVGHFCNQSFSEKYISCGQVSVSTLKYRGHFNWSFEGCKEADKQITSR